MDKSPDGKNEDSNGSTESSASDRPIPLKDMEAAMIDEIVTSYKSSLDIGARSTTADHQSNSIGDLVNVCEVSIRRVIDMAKKMKSFKALPQGAQICLLKGGSIELLIIRSVLAFDQQRELFLDERDNPQTSAITLDQFKSAATTGEQSANPAAAGKVIDPMLQFSLVEDVMKFIKVVGVDLKADETMLIFLLLVSLFSPDRPNLDAKDLKDAVAKEQEKYSMLLRRYVESKMPISRARIYYAKLLMKLTDIRNLNEESSQVFLNTLNTETIQPLMKEVLDIQPGAAAAAMPQSAQSPAVVTAKS